MASIHEILLKNWGHSSFRPLQEDIINSVLSGKDTLALLRTGGGKSICFQVPALAREGICIVVSPLIALMKDQVSNLQKRGIKAEAIYSGLSYKEIDILLDNCIYGQIKFLYVSPERLTTDLFKERIINMNVNLIAVDEAHCISQWGYDFRPPYLEIAKLKELKPNVPVLALTATATPDVVIDIQEKLKFKEPNVFQKSFERSNITYYVAYEENKTTRLLNIANKIAGTGIVYVRNRRKTEEIAKFLNANGISADYYHAGLTNELRDNRQHNWIVNKTRVIVATNAFGMGIDKPDVRWVVHLDLSDSLEAYFQEAGRGGRDEKPAYAIQLVANSDIVELKRQFENTFPPLETIKKIYQSIGNFLKLAVGSGKEELFDFNLSVFCEKFGYKPIEVYNSIKYIQREGYITFSEGVYQPSRLMFLANKAQLLENEKHTDFIQLILRSYTGIFDRYVAIKEGLLAKRSGLGINEVKHRLNKLQELEIIDYQPQPVVPQLYFNTERISDKNFAISPKTYQERKKVAFRKLKAVVNYATEPICRSYLLLTYFGEDVAATCGQCDVCRKGASTTVKDGDFKTIEAQLKTHLIQPQSLDNIMNKFAHLSQEKLIETLRWLADNGLIEVDGDSYYWKKQ